MAHIAFILPDVHGGGAERVGVNLVNDLAARGHEVDLVLMQRSGELLDLVRPEVRIIDLGTPRARDVLRPLANYFREARPDAIQVSMWPLTVIAILARGISRSRARLVVSDHAILSNHVPARLQPVLRLTTRLFYPAADARVAVSGGAARDLARLSGIAESRFSVITNPIAFPAKIERSESVEALWGEASKRILTVGNLKRVKNHAMLIRAFGKLPAELDAKLMILGTGTLEPELKRLAADCGVGERVLFPGFAPDPWPYYASADLFVLGSDEESFGNVLVEALYAGLPVVSTRNTGAREVLGDGEYGALVASGDVEAFAQAMEQALGEPGHAAKTRARALAMSGPGSLQQYESLLLNCLAV